MDQASHNAQHLECRDVEAAKCDLKRECDCDLYRLWITYQEEESGLRHIEHQIENRVDGHFCKEDASGAYIANGTTHVFRQTSVPIMEAFKIQWPEVVIAEAAYDNRQPQCETKYHLLDENLRCVMQNKINSKMRLVTTVSQCRMSEVSSIVLGHRQCTHMTSLRRSPVS